MANLNPQVGAALPRAILGLLARLTEGQDRALGADPLGSYVFGSVVTGDFDPGISDVDTVVVLRSDPTEAQLAALERLHHDIDEEMSEWNDRIEVVYLSSRALSTFRTESSPAARISPGEPFHGLEDDHPLVDRLVPAS